MKKLILFLSVTFWAVKSDREYDPKELAMGIEVEYEHTNMKRIAKTIAKHHLSEFPDYYTRLKKMEKKAKKYWKERN